MISQSISSDLKEPTVKYILPNGRCTGLLLGWWSLLHGVGGGPFFTYSLLLYFAGTLADSTLVVGIMCQQFDNYHIMIMYFDRPKYESVYYDNQ